MSTLVTPDVTVHLTDAECVAEISVADLTEHSDPFVSLKLGDHVDIFLRDQAVLDALEEALTEARHLLAAASDKAAA